MPREQEKRESINYLAPALIAICVLAGLLLWYLLEQPARKVQEPPPVVAEQSPVTGAIEAPEIQYPVPEIPVEAPAAPEIPAETIAPAPEPAKPEPSIEEQFTRLFDWPAYGQLFLLEALINHFVVTVDNLTGPKLPQKFAFTQPPAGKFIVQQDAAGAQVLDPKNYERYSKFVQFTVAADSNRFVAFYVRHYPRFQQAYEELGYPGRYFNDRFVAVIDHLLATPDAQGPILLVRPKVYYQLADPALEALSAGQKILIRIGPANALLVKTKLRELRQALTTLKRQ